jgi:hypothetical protein
MSKIYFYKMTVDDGGAPCVQNGLLSLAICKPMIRSVADKGDLIIGFAANRLHSDNRLIYVALVDDKLINGDYFKGAKYASRADCIYEWKNGYFQERKGALYHGNQGDLEHDLGKAPGYKRANTLLSKHFCYFGKAGTNGYKLRFPLVKAVVENLGQGHRVNHPPLLVEELNSLATWACPLNGPCDNGQPTSEPRCGVTHRGGGCGVVERCGRC